MAKTNNKKVLIVDDEPGVRKLIRKILHKTYDIIEAENGEEALDIIYTQKPDIVLMDMMMPRMDGFTACCKIKSDGAIRQIPVVMVTAVSFDLNRKLSNEVSGADGFITKPFAPKELVATINQLLNKTSEKSLVPQKT